MELNLTDSDLVYHVRNALKAAFQGDHDYYNQLVAVIHRRDTDDDYDEVALATCLKALAGAVSYMDIDHHPHLVAALVGMSLWNYGTDVMDALVELLTSLAASSGKCVDLCLTMLVKSFMPPPSSDFINSLKQKQGLDKKHQVLDRVHSALQDIAYLVPLSPLILEKIVVDIMPNKYTKEPFMVMYVENVLRLERGVLGKLIGGSMLLAIMDLLIDLDVEIHRYDILQDDFSKEIFDMEIENLEGFPIQAKQDDIKFTGESLIQWFSRGKLFAQKLDSLLVLTFEHLESCYQSGRLIQVFETLLHSFQKTVLPADGSQFTQFVMFYACSLDPDNCGKMFASTLLNTFMSSVHSKLRLHAAAYLASYLSRAKFLTPSFITTTLESLVNWCFDYCNNQDGGINLGAHEVFYTGCQAIMYVLCFHMRSMISLPRLKWQILFMRFGDILGHRLNPLQVCLPSIVEEFLRLAKTNQTFSLPHAFVDYKKERLDTFFPFDPCLLRKSDRFIRPNFVYWSMVSNSFWEDDEEESASDEDVGITMVETNLAADNIILDEFGCSLDKMSITPTEFGGRIQGFVRMPSKIRPSISPGSL